MTTLLCLLYASLCIVAFRLLRLPVNQWTLATTVLGGVVLIGGIVIAMNYNHPFTTEARLYFYATPISPAVNGQVVDVPVAPNTHVKKGDVLFRLDPRPFEYALAHRKAALAKAQQDALERQAALKGANAAVDSARDSRDRAKDDYDRHATANARAGGKGDAPFSEAEVVNRRDLYLAAESALTSAAAQADQARLAANAQIGGIDTTVAQLEAEVARAEFDLEQSVYRAPTDGYAAQVFLHPGMMAVSLPLRPVMTFVHTDRRVFAAAFNQLSLQRVAAGDEAEISFAAVPGQVFRGTVKTVVETMATGQLEPSGTLLAPDDRQAPGRMITVIDLGEEVAAYNLPGGATAEVAVYTKSMAALAIIRRILLRMRAWENYLVFDR
ncbi:HlyD family secretion protein [Phyllobacterium pellucidum]|uniref:HlyD family secretion protein n=1 Tax=Phyllobacterium pellucidum TaxID=2740464 RepID=UPI001D13C08F|nr:HlyD family secretion protein [Phyllobacterium sp. T1018]UGY11420.1 HlyD family secretion protein [Phyllobacterium sp. T1018]